MKNFFKDIRSIINSNEFLIWFGFFFIFPALFFLLISPIGIALHFDKTQGTLNFFKHIFGPFFGI